LAIVPVSAQIRQGAGGGTGGRVNTPGKDQHEDVDQRCVVDRLAIYLSIDADVDETRSDSFGLRSPTFDF
jgi:hypothetical protein